MAEKSDNMFNPIKKYTCNNRKPKGQYKALLKLIDKYQLTYPEMAEMIDVIMVDKYGHTDDIFTGWV